MNITTTRIQKPLQLQAVPTATSSTFAPEQGGGIKDSFQAVGHTIAAHPMRSVMNTANLASMLGTLSTLGDASVNGQFCRGAGVALGVGQLVAGFVRGMDSLTSLGYAESGITGQPPRNVGFSAIGDLMTAAGQLAMVNGVTAPAVALVMGGSALSSAFDYTS